MRYVGGKYRIAKHLVPHILADKPEIVVEPFCGALNVTVAILNADPKVVVYANDIHTDLIDMWKSVQNGWEPPETMSKDEYYELRSMEPSPLRTFAGYGCSFSGKFWGGYASDSTGRNYCGNARNSILKIKKHLNRVVFSSASYTEVIIPKNSVVYCDPPYAGTTKPGERNSFSHEEFWQWVRNIDNKVFVSEYQAPKEFEVVWSMKVKTDMHTKSGKEDRIERLFSNPLKGSHEHRTVYESAV